jgi:hypothetical protein
VLTECFEDATDREKEVHQMLVMTYLQQGNKTHEFIHTDHMIAILAYVGAAMPGCISEILSWLEKADALSFGKSKSADALEVDEDMIKLIATH